MSKLLENKQLVHIASEVVVLVCLVFYFNQKNKKLMTHIEDLAQRLEEQEDLLQKHEQIIRKLCERIGQQQRPSPPPVPENPRPSSPPKEPFKSRVSRHAKPVRVSFAPQEPPVPNSPPDSESDSDNSGDDELDAQLIEELQELKENGDEKQVVNLKKEP